MSRFLKYAVLVALLASSPALAKPQTFEQEALENALIHCIVPISKKLDVSTEAVKSIVALPGDKASKIDHTAAKVFTILSSRGEQFLSVLPSGDCRVFVRKVKAMDFWTEAGQAFGIRSPFTYIETKDLPDGLVKIYHADFGGPTELQIYVRDIPPPTGFQVMVNFVRVQEEE